MKLTGVASRAVGYYYWAAVFANLAEYVITQNGVYSASLGTGVLVPSGGFQISADGANWFYVYDSNTLVAQKAAGAKNKIKLFNSTGGDLSLAVVGVYWT